MDIALIVVSPFNTALSFYIHEDIQRSLNKEHNKMTDINRDQEKFARESFTMRKMKKWQLWSITIACIVLVVAGVLYSVN